MLNLIRQIVQRTKAIRKFERDLALHTPLIEGRETRKVARALEFDADRAARMIREVPFDGPDSDGVNMAARSAYCDRALEWARGG